MKKKVNAIFDFWIKSFFLASLINIVAQKIWNDFDFFPDVDSRMGFTFILAVLIEVFVPDKSGE